MFEKERTVEWKDLMLKSRPSGDTRPSPTQLYP